VAHQVNIATGLFCGRFLVGDNTNKRQGRNKDVAMTIEDLILKKNNKT
jgi:hypothetical protein